MKEIFVIYDSTTGFLEGGSGKIDREWDAKNADGSTVSERIPKILAKNPNREVIYLPYQKLPDRYEHKISKGKIVKLTVANKKVIKAAEPKSKIELLDERVTVLEAA